MARPLKTLSIGFIGQKENQGVCSLPDDRSPMDAAISIGSESPQQNPVKEYLTYKELAQHSPYKEQTWRNFVAKGIPRLGVHYNKPNGGRPVFKWSAIKRFLEGEVI